ATDRALAQETGIRRHVTEGKMVRPINDTEIRLMVPHAIVEWIRAEIGTAPGDEGYREAFDDFVRGIFLEYSIHRRGHGATIDVTRAVFRAARKLESEYDLPIVEAETRAEAH